MGTDLERGHTGEAGKQPMSCSEAGDKDQGRSIAGRRALALGVENPTASVLKFTFNKSGGGGLGQALYARLVLWPVASFSRELVLASFHAIGRK